MGNNLKYMCLVICIINVLWVGGTVGFSFRESGSFPDDGDGDIMDSIIINGTVQSWEQQSNSIIERVMTLYESHINELDSVEHVIVLSWAKIHDDKHGGTLQERYPLMKWINQICSKSTDTQVETECRALPSNLKVRDRQSRVNDKTTKTNKVVGKHGTMIDQSGIFHGRLSAKCKMDLLLRCEVSKICEETYFNRKPFSSDGTSVQDRLQNSLIEMKKCTTKLRDHDESTYDELCSKMYMQNELIAQAHFPNSSRDVFVENLGYCLNLGYVDFLRYDWLYEILSWQTEGDYECLFILAAEDFTRLDSTVKEQPTGQRTEPEMCPRPRGGFLSNVLAVLNLWSHLRD